MEKREAQVNIIPGSSNHAFQTTTAEDRHSYELHPSRKTYIVETGHNAQQSSSSCFLQPLKCLHKFQDNSIILNSDEQSLGFTRLLN
ncbi:hypothetical protein MUK42_19143 [Musa troglodytarum]|uniref:Uncharacterized protein n=1 Tax=Musa troglodytarum TaxID=320322 RepID=A0A9E7EZ83_9LILI|nr:hypothetical protein MUK42_19143 [Musa troglodytarum]